MFKISNRIALSLCAACLLQAGATYASATETNSNQLNQGKNMQQIRGSFEVQLQAQPAADAIVSAELGRRTIVKQFHGELQASSLGEMLSVHTPVKGSAAYVALERVSGTLGGKRGSFVLMHTGLMDKGQSSLTVQVVADSATGELQGLRGSMQIEIREGKHFYVFDYQLPSAQSPY